MRIAGAKKQTFFLTGINGIVRALGLVLRIWTSRCLGAEAMGIIELAQSIHMVAISPLTSGLPAAISRLTARAEPNCKTKALETGLWLSRKASFVLVPGLWLLSPFLSKVMGDVRVLPSLWFTAPCILILGYSASYNGYCYGLERSEIPALSELIEQIVRFMLTILLISLLKQLTLPWMAAVPVAATMAAELVGLVFVMSVLPRLKLRRVPSPAWTKAVLKLSIPSTANRLLQTVLRSLTAILIPLRLQAGGLSAAEATSQLGRLNGMVMPVLMLPGVFTSALSMVTIPKIAKAEEQPFELRRLLLICLLSALPLSAFCAVLVWLFAPPLANAVYHQSELTVLFRLSAFQIPLAPLNHLLSTTLSALGQQKKVFYVSSASAICSLILTWLWAGSSQLGIRGVIYAQYISQCVSVLLSGIALLGWRRRHRGYA